MISFGFMFIGYKLHVSGIIEALVIGGWALFGFPSMFIGVSSPLGPIKAMLLVRNFCRGHGLGLITAILTSPLFSLMLTAVLFLAIAVFSIVCPPITCVIGVLHSLFNLRAVKKGYVPCAA